MSCSRCHDQLTRCCGELPRREAEVVELRRLLVDVRALVHLKHSGEVEVCIDPICKHVSDGLEMS